MDILLDFGEKLSVVDIVSKPVVKTHKGSGRGKKQCLSCKVYVGVRTRQCPCGAEFKKISAPVRTDLKPKSDDGDSECSLEKRIIPKTTREYSTILFTPAGECPIKFPIKEPTEEAIISWAENLREVHLDRKTYLTTEGIIYFSREFMNVFSNEYKRVRAIIIAWDG